MSENDHKVNRRALLLGAVVLLGGAGALTRFKGKSPDGAAKSGPEMSAEQFALLEQITETMIPTTDTPGAIAAGVPVFIRHMLSEWASPASRIEVAEVL